MTPETISHYRILSKLGAGGMGEVYLAEDLKLGRRVALKLLPAKFTQDPERVRRFEQEARAASATSHPNILTIYEIGHVETETGVLHFMAMEFVEGQTLRQRLKQGLKLDEAIEIAIQIAGALAAAHGERAGDLDRNFDRFVQLQALFQPLAQGLALDELHRHEMQDPGLSLDVSDLINGQNVRM